MSYKTTIGMEVHVELATESKMFCSCKNGMGQEPIPNNNICPVCTGQPGAIPVPNAQAIEFTVQAGLALNCEIASVSKFDRKNYFYPDLPKGYQISQYDQPICGLGYVDFVVKDEKGKVYIKKVRIHRIHLEEDTGKLIHEKSNEESLIDYNRSSVPLMELVSEADIENAAEAKKFCEELRLIFRYIGISPADMEKGQMRCEANISLYEEGKDKLSGTKVELKNLNSFKAVERGIEYEIKRQSQVIDRGEKVVQETRGWNESKGITFSQRVKENADDYRYFPEPDILPFELKSEYVNVLMEKLPELPWEKRRRFVEQFGLLQENADILVTSKDLSNYFEQVCSELDAWMNAESREFDDKQTKKLYRLVANYILTELSRMMGRDDAKAAALKITPENFAELIKMIYEGRVNSSAAQTVLAEMYATNGDPSDIIEQKNLTQTSDESELTLVVETVLEENESSVKDYKAGKENAIKFLVGQTMMATQGRANPQVVMEILKKKLDK